MATVPLSGTNVRLLSGVPFANDYKHTRWFDTQTQQTDYFLAKPTVHMESQMTFQRIEGQNFIAVNKSIDALWGTNYLMFQNAEYNNKWFYAFVTKLEYKQKNTTYVHFEIDVLQTWKFEMNFKPSYVVREHCKLWNADGTPVVNTVDEGLNYGTDYDVVYSKNYAPNLDIFYLVIVAKSLLHRFNDLAPAGTIKSSLNGSPQPLCYYIHPFRLDGSGVDFWDGSMRPVWNYETDPNFDPETDEPEIVDYVPDIKELTNIKTVLSRIFSQETAVNNVVSMYITEHIGYEPNYASFYDALTFNDGFHVADVGGGINTIYVENLPQYFTSDVDCGDKYYGFKSVDESKLLMYPYALTIIDDYKGNRVVLKNEYIDNDKLYVTTMGSIGTSNKVAYVPRDYLTQNILDFNERSRLAIENGLIDSTPHDIPVLAEMLSAFLQGNRNSLQNQAQTIQFNGTMDIVSGVVGGFAALFSRNSAGIASSGVNMVRGAGNSILQLEGMQAKIKDISNVPPQLAKMGSNTAFDYGNGYKGFYVIKKQIKPEYRKKLSDFFKMYGYKVNEVKMPNFHTRRYWNFVQTNSCVILGNFNNEDLQELKDIFDNGITLWHTDDVGNYSLTNEVIA